MRRLAYLLLLLGSHAVAGTKIDPPGAPDRAALRGSVVVWHDATFYAEPADGAHALQLATFDAPRKDRIGHVVALKVVSTKGGFVEVELTGQQDCAWARVVVPDDLARVRMFVRRADLAPVLTRPFSKTFGDGTSIALAAGTPLGITDAGTYVVSLHGDEVEVDVPATSVGYSYAASKARAPIMAGSTLAVAPATQATLGERTFTLGARQGAPVERRGDSTLLALDAGCVTAQVVVASTSLSDVDDSASEPSASSEGNDVVSLRDECFLPRLTPLSIGTRQVALAAKPIYLHAEPMGKHACVQRMIRIESALPIKPTDDKLRVCAPATKVLRERLRTARSAPR